MPTFISLLRGINVGGHRKIRMADLTGAYEKLGLTNVRTYVQSGNVVFGCAIRSTSKVAALIEQQIQSCFGHDVNVLIRTPRDLRRIIDTNPFSTAAKKDPAKVSMMFLTSRPLAALAKSCEAVDSGKDKFSVGRQEIYLHCPDGAGRTKLNSAFFERRLKMPTTSRNWRTVEALYDMAVSS